MAVKIKIELVREVLQIPHPSFPSDWEATYCIYTPPFYLDFIDLFGSEEDTYTTQTFEDLTGSRGTYTCWSTYSNNSEMPFHTGLFAVAILRNGSPVLNLPDNTIVLDIQVERSEDMSNLLLFDEIITGKGLVDVHNLAGFGNLEMGLWHGRLSVLGYVDKSTNKNFYLNPTRYKLGNLDLSYHGFSSHLVPINTLKIYIPLHSFFDSLEPQGTVAQYNVWVPVPWIPRASGLHYFLNPGCSARLEIWGLVMLKGFDVYF